MAARRRQRCFPEPTLLLVTTICVCIINCANCKFSILLSAEGGHGCSSSRRSWLLFSQLSRGDFPYVFINSGDFLGRRSETRVGSLRQIMLSIMLEKGEARKGRINGKDEDDLGEELRHQQEQQGQVSHRLAGVSQRLRADQLISTN